jgi:hypothetical protein
MTDKKDGPGKGPERAAPEGAAAQRPFATLDLKATEVKSEPGKPPATSSKPPAAGGPVKEEPRPQAEAAAKVAAASSAQRQPPPAGETKPGASQAAAGATAARVADSAGARAGAATTAPPPARSGSGFGRIVSHMAAGIAGGVVAIVGVQSIAPMLGLDPVLVRAGREPAPAPMSPEAAARLAAIEKTVQERLAAASGGQQAAEAAGRQVQELARQVATLAESQTRLAGEAAELRKAQAAAPAGSEPGERLQKLEDQIAAMAAAAAADPQRAGRLPQLAQLTGKVTDLETQVATRFDRLRKDTTQEIDARFVAATEASEAAKAGAQRLDREVAAVRSDTTRLGQRVDQLKSGADRTEQAVKSLEENATGLRGAIDGLKADLDAQLKTVARPADIARAMTPVTDKLAALESSMQGVVKAEEDRRANAERIVLSLELGNLKRAMERGTPYAAELGEVKRIAGSRLDISALERYQATGVPTLVELARSFGPVANAILDIDATPEDAGVVDKLLTSAKTIVRVRRTSHSASDASAEAIVGRMESALRDGRLGDVVSEASKLPPRTAAPAADWLRKVQARQTVDKQLADIDAALKSSLGGGPKPDAKR